MELNPSTVDFVLGGLAIAVPGELRAYQKAHDQFGRIPWRDLFQPTIDLCRNGYVISPSQGEAIRQSKDAILADPTLKFEFSLSTIHFQILFSFRAFFVKNNQTNELYTTNDIMKRPKYADTLEKIANQSADAFYTGDLAKTIAKEVQARNGIITEEDLAEYQADFAEALSVSLNDSLTAFTTHAPSSGPILMFILNILRGIVWKNLFRRF